MGDFFCFRLDFLKKAVSLQCLQHESETFTQGRRKQPKEIHGGLFLLPSGAWEKPSGRHT